MRPPWRDSLAIAALAGLLSLVACGERDELEDAASDINLVPVERGDDRGANDRDDGSDLDDWCETMLELRDADPDDAERLDEIGDLLHAAERDAPAAIAGDVALVAQVVRALLDGESVEASELRTTHAASERLDDFMADECVLTLRNVADREGEPCPEPLDSSSAAARLHELCGEVFSIAFGLQTFVVPAVTGENELPPDGDGPDWNGISAFCSLKSPDPVQAIADESQDDEAGRLAAELASALDDFLTGCRDAVEIEDVELFRSLDDVFDRLTELSTAIVKANNGDLDGPD